MDKKEILEKRKQNTLEAYELDSQLAPCIEYFKRDGDEIEFQLKQDFECDGCDAVICFALLEGEEFDEPNPMYG